MSRDNLESPEKTLLILKKIMHIIAWVSLGFLVLAGISILLLSGSLGDIARHYSVKALYYTFNPKDKPLAELVIDLNQGYEFVLNHVTPKGLLHRSGWWLESESDMDEKERLELSTPRPMHPFEHFKLTVLWDDITLVIPNAQVLSVYFKDYKRPGTIDDPKAHGIDSVQISSIDNQPMVVNGKALWRRTDYPFVYSQYQKLASMFTDSSFARNALADEIQKHELNKWLGEYNGNSPCIKYKTWTKGNFDVTLILEFDGQNREYSNEIYISPKDRLKDN